MKVIFAESGREITIDNECCPNLLSLKKYLETITNINYNQQIILLPTGIQVKDKNYISNLNSDNNNTNNTTIFILFNRQHLEFGPDLISSDSLECLVKKGLPIIGNDEDDDKKLKDIFDSCLSLDNDIRKQKGRSNISQFTELYKLMSHNIHYTCNMITDLANQNGDISINIINELKSQNIALNAALLNLENHIKTTYDSQNKFERIAKRELMKTTQILLAVQKDITFMQNLRLHPRIQTQLDEQRLLQSPSLSSSSPSSSHSNDHFSITVFIEMKVKLEKEYDRLEKKVKKQSHKMDDIRQQANHINIQRSGSEVVLTKVTDLNQEIQMAFDKIRYDLKPRLEEYWDFNMDLDRMNDILLDYSDDNSINNGNNTNSSREKNSTDHYHSHEVNNRINDNKNYNHDTDVKDHPSSPTMNNNSNSYNNNNIIKLSNKQQLQHLFSLQTSIKTFLTIMIEEKKDTMINFFRCLQKVSSLEESIASLLLSIRNLGKDLKKLNHQTNHLHRLSKNVIKSYGIMLIEIWRRDQYYQIITKNAELLNNLFTSFTLTEKQYRDLFQNKLYMVDGIDISYLNNEINSEICLIPFILEEFNKDKLSSATTLEISISSDQYNILKQRNLLCKLDVLEYISMIDSYYTFQGKQDDIIIDMVQTLNSILNNELKRLTQGLIKLGLPNNKSKKKIPNTIPFSSPSTPLSSTQNSSPLMQVQPSFSMPFLSQTTHNWSSSSNDYAENQDLKLKIQKLEEQLKQDRQLYEQQRMFLHEEIKAKDKQILEKEQQWLSKVKELEEKLNKEKYEHEHDILEWKTRYEEALDIEQQKHYRRLSDFHERLDAKNLEYAKLERRLSQSLPSLPPTSPSSLLSQIETVHHGSNEPTLSSSSALINHHQQHHQHHKEENKIIHPMAIHLAIKSKELSFKEQSFAQEIQDLVFHHQALVDNMKTEHEETILVLKEYHEQEIKQIQMESETYIQTLRDQLLEEQDNKIQQLNKTWEQQIIQMKQEKKEEEESTLLVERLNLEKEKRKEHDQLNKQLTWSRAELNMILKEQEYAIQLAKQLIYTMDDTFDINDMNFTLQTLLEKIIRMVSKFETNNYIENQSKSSFHFENIMPFFM
ncbi:unnamed protein product [Cunninghamella echinulata]